jgi:hypothetical protein
MTWVEGRRQPRRSPRGRTGASWRSGLAHRICRPSISTPHRPRHRLPNRRNPFDRLPARRGFRARSTGSVAFSSRRGRNPMRGPGPRIGFLRVDGRGRGKASWPRAWHGREARLPRAEGAWCDREPGRRESLLSRRHESRSPASEASAGPACLHGFSSDDNIRFLRSEKCTAIRAGDRSWWPRGPRVPPSCAGGPYCKPPNLSGPKGPAIPMARAAGRAHWCDPLAGSAEMTWVERRVTRPGCRRQRLRAG